MQLKKKSFLSFSLLLWDNIILRLLWTIGLRPSSYESISDITLAKWWKVQETGDVTLLIKNKFRLTQGIVDYCSNLWDDIRQEHLDAFGVPKNYSKYWNLKADIAIKEMDYAISQNNWDLFLLNLGKDDLIELESQPRQSNIQAKSLVEKYWLNGNRIDPEVTTLEEYSNYVKLLEQSATHGKSN